MTAHDPILDVAAARSAAERRGFESGFRTACGLAKLRIRGLHAYAQQTKPPWWRRGRRKAALYALEAALVAIDRMQGSAGFHG